MLATMPKAVLLSVFLGEEFNLSNMQ